MATRLSKFRALTVLRMRLIEGHTLQQCAQYLGIGIPAVHAWEQALAEKYGDLHAHEWARIEQSMLEAWNPAWSWPEFVRREVDTVG